MKIIDSLDALYNMVDNGINLVGYSVSNSVASNFDRHRQLVGIDGLDGVIEINAQNVIILHSDV